MDAIIGARGSNGFEVFFAAANDVDGGGVLGVSGDSDGWFSIVIQSSGSAIYGFGGDMVLTTLALS